MHNSNEKDYYAILQVNRNADSEVIKKVYNLLCKKYHPDANADSLEEATVKMQEINEAYEVLSDNDKREDYNKTYDEKENKKVKNDEDDRDSILEIINNAKNIIFELNKIRENKNSMINYYNIYYGNRTRYCYLRARVFFEKIGIFDILTKMVLLVLVLNIISLNIFHLDPMFKLAAIVLSLFFVIKLNTNIFWGFIFGAFGYFLSGFISKRKKEDIKKDVELLIEREEQYQADLNKITEIPEKYKVYEILNLFEEYLINMRASNLKEAINLYELNR